MLPDRVSNPGSPTYESGALPIALRGPAMGHSNHYTSYITQKGSKTLGLDKTPFCLKKNNNNKFLCFYVLFFLHIFFLNSYFKHMNAVSVLQII